jgi:arylsulfatase A-like enzyme
MNNFPAFGRGKPARISNSVRGPGLPFLLVLLTLVLSASAAPKNILIIIADDYGAESSSLYNTTNTGASLPTTPNITALAQSGVLFRRAYANPVCSPTRACLITGRHGFRTGVGDVIEGAGSAALRASEFTLPEAFAANPSLNYSLAQFGKWHLALGPNSPSVIGGWPHFAGSTAGAIANYTNWTKTVNGTATANYTNYATTDVVNDAVAWIQARGSQPWFAWVAFNAPHTPYHKPPTNLAPHYAMLSGTQQNINANPRPYFEAMTEAMDTEIGRLLAAVDRTNTHIIFLGDNGTPTQVLQPPFPSGRGKDTLYEGGIKVPLIVAGPAVANPGRTNDTLVHAVDVYATILEMAGISVTSTVPAGVKIDSQSLLHALAATTNLARYAYSEKFGSSTPSPDARALRDDRYKLINYTGGTYEFYDLQSDPIESTNLLASALTAEQQKYFDRLQYRLGGYSTNTGPALISPRWSGGRFAVSCAQTSGASYALWRCDDPVAGFWSPVSGAVVGVTNSVVTLTDPSAPSGSRFYGVVQTP